MPEKFKDRRKQRNDDDRHDHETEIIFDQGEIAEIVPGEEANRDPKEAGHEVAGQEPDKSHSAQARDKGGKGSNDRHELGHDDRFGPMLFVKCVGPLEVPPVQKADLFPAKDFRSDQ